MLVSNYAIKFRTAVFVFIAIFILIGVISYMRLPREGSPDITIPYVFVTAVYEGTAPTEIEKLIAIPIEKQINDVEGIKEMRSTSSENVCSIVIEFLAGEDIDQAKQRVKDKVDLARPDLPDDLDEPIVDAFNISSDFPIFRFTIAGATDMVRLKNLAEEVRDQLELLPGVKAVEIAGVREREIRVELDLPRLVSYGIPIPLVMQRIAQENSTVSAGNMEIAGDKFQIRVPGEFEMVSEIRDIVVSERNGKPIYLRDVAAVRDTYKDATTVSRLNGNPCVSISMKKRSGENSVKLIGAAKEALDAISLPPGISMTTVYDESDYVDMMIKELENNVSSGFLLVIVALFIFMGMRNSFFVALAIPLSMLIAFAFMSFAGTTLNMIVLFSLVLAVGMLVDNAIVIVENIYRNRGLGMTRIEAARRGAAEVAWPVITSTLTTCAAFSPLLFWPDIMGQFMGFMPRTLIIVLSASLFVALVINPAVCSAFITSPVAKKPNGRNGDGEQTHRFVRGYEALLRGALHHRVVVFLIGLGFLMLTVLVYARWGKGVELFPDIEPRNAQIQIRFPQGTSLDRTDALLRRIEGILPKYDDVEFYLSEAGSGGGGFAIGGGVGGTHVGNIHVEFLDAEDRTGDTRELVARIREDVGRVPGVEITVAKEEEGPPTGAPVSIEVSGDEFDTLAELSGRIMRRIETVPGLVDLQDDLEEALPELQFQVDRYRAALLGLDTDTVGLFLRTSIYGLESSRLRAEEDEFDITLRLPADQRDSFDLLDRIYIPTAGGNTVPLSSVGDVEYVGGRGAISRKDQKRVITITGNDEGRGVDKIIADVREQVQEMVLPRGYGLYYAGDTQEMRESGAFLFRAFLVALALIVVILVLQFNSVLLPGVIILSVVMSLIGVMWGLLICGMRFGVIMTGVGVISLAGIVVNNAIVLVDCIQQRRAEGLSATDAVMAAGRLRLRPVLLTALTTILGLIPMAVGYSLEVHEWPPSIIAGAESSQWWAPMAVAVIFGLGVATMLTLVLVPVMYSLSDSLVACLRRLVSPAAGSGVE